MFLSSFSVTGIVSAQQLEAEGSIFLEPKVLVSFFCSRFFSYSLLQSG